MMVSQVVDKPGSAARIFQALGDAGVSVDMIVQNVGRNGVANLTFTVPRNDFLRAERTVTDLLADDGGGEVEIFESIAKVSVVGIGMRSHSGVAAILFAALAGAGVNIQLISTSEIKISVVIDLDSADRAARTVHAAFNLDRV